MPPRADIAHLMPGRVRLRVTERRGDEAWFRTAVAQLGECPTVSHVTASTVTGSLLVLHDGEDIDVIESYAKAVGLFDVIKASAPIEGRPAAPDVLIRSGLEHADRWVRRESGEGTDFRSLALVGLLGTAMWQALRGQILPAGGTLIWYALTLSGARSDGARDVERAGRGERAGAAETRG